MTQLENSIRNYVNATVRSSDTDDIDKLISWLLIDFTKTLKANGDVSTFNKYSKLNTPDKILMAIRYRLAE